MKWATYSQIKTSGWDLEDNLGVDVDFSFLFGRKLGGSSLFPLDNDFLSQNTFVSAVLWETVKIWHLESASYRYNGSLIHLLIGHMYIY